MKEDRESFIFHKDWYNAISQLDKDLRLELYDAIMRKALYNEPPSLSPMGNLAMSFIEPQIERDFDKWLDIREKRSNAGKAHKGNQYSAAEQTEHKQTNGTSVPTLEQTEQDGTNGTVSVSVTVSDNVSVDNNNVILKEKEDTIISSKKEKRFVKPTIQEIQAHILEKGYMFDAEAFYAFYESNGWKVGKNPMKNWKMACTTWAKNRKNNNNNVNYGRETITDKIRRTVEESNIFSQQLTDRIGNQQQADVCGGDNDEVW